MYSPLVSFTFHCLTIGMDFPPLPLRCRVVGAKRFLMASLTTSLSSPGEVLASACTKSSRETMVTGEPVSAIAIAGAPSTSTVGMGPMIPSPGWDTGDTTCSVIRVLFRVFSATVSGQLVSKDAAGGYSD